MTGFFSRNPFHPAKKAALLLAALTAALAFSACGVSGNESSLSDGSSTAPSSSAPEVSATEDPTLKGEGSVSMLEVLGSKDSGFAFSGAEWFSGREDFLQGLSAQWPDVAGDLTAEYESGDSGVYLTAGMAQFSDYPFSACFRITACSYVFSFGADQEE